MGRRPGRPLPPALNLAALLLLLLLTGEPRSLVEAQRAPCNASATPPGLTRTQYPLLNALMEELSQHGLVILGFPCNQFGLQEPGTDAAEILNGLRYVRPGGGFVPNFPLFKRIDVNGDSEAPLYTFLKASCPAPVERFEKIKSLFYEPLKSSDLRWNFDKFLVDAQGRPYMRYDRLAPFELVRGDLVQLLRSQTSRTNRVTTRTQAYTYAFRRRQ
ncbi:unnamed protein product [Lampetra planeri]